MGAEMMDFRLKVWLEKDGQQVFGNGLMRLLTLVNQHGSIRRAAEDMKMSYRQAWGNIKKAEDRLNVKLLIKQIGGESGGGAKLTSEAEELIAKFYQFRSEVESAAKKSFERYFN